MCGRLKHIPKPPFSPGTSLLLYFPSVFLFFPFVFPSHSPLFYLGVPFPFSPSFRLSPAVLYSIFQSHLHRYSFKCHFFLYFLSSQSYFIHSSLSRSPPSLSHPPSFTSFPPSPRASSSIPHYLSLRNTFDFYWCSVASYEYRSAICPSRRAPRRFSTRSSHGDDGSAPWRREVERVFCDDAAVCLVCVQLRLFCSRLARLQSLFFL